jgi:hypothetical protein
VLSEDDCSELASYQCCCCCCCCCCWWCRCCDCCCDSRCCCERCCLPLTDSRASMACLCCCCCCRAVGTAATAVDVAVIGSGLTLSDVAATSLCAAVLATRADAVVVAEALVAAVVFGAAAVVPGVWCTVQQYDTQGQLLRWRCRTVVAAAVAAEQLDTVGTHFKLHVIEQKAATRACKTHVLHSIRSQSADRTCCTGTKH